MVKQRVVAKGLANDNYSLLDGPAGQGCAEVAPGTSWNEMPDLHQAFEKNVIIKQKRQKGSPNRVSWDHSFECVFSVFSLFSGILKNPCRDKCPSIWNEAGVAAPRKNNINLWRARKQTRAVWKPGSLNKRRLRRTNYSSSSSCWCEIWIVLSTGGTIGRAEVEFLVYHT